MTVCKICGLTNLKDALHAWRCGADLLGFVAVPSSPRYIAPEEVAPIISQLWMLGCQCKTVLVVASEDKDEINHAAYASGANLVQVHGDAVPGGLVVPHLVAHRVREHIPWETLLESLPVAVVLDAYSRQALGGTGERWDYAVLDDPARPADLRVLVAGGLTADNVSDVIERTHPWGVDVSSGVEAEPSRKDPDKVRRFIETVRGEAS